MADSFTEVTYTGWFGRIKNAMAGVLVGLALFLVSFVVLFWNEGRAVKRARALAEGQKSVISVGVDKVDPANENRLVHISGRAETDETLRDSVFGISDSVLRLKREVEMYQWKEDQRSETRKKLGGGQERYTTYTYQRTWSSDRINSNEFKESGHSNPSDWPYSSQVWDANSATIGAFTIPQSLIRQINEFTPVPISEHRDSVPEEIQKTLQMTGTGFYKGNSSSPAIGDLRISFFEVSPTDVSIVAKQIGNTLGEFITSGGQPLQLLNVGAHSADGMFQQAVESNKTMTWLLRLVGFIAMFIGLTMLMAPLSVLADVIPLLGNLVGFVAGLFALCIAAALSLITIAVAWISYRPLIGIPLLVVGLLCIGGGVATAMGKRQANA